MFAQNPPMSWLVPGAEVAVIIAVHSSLSTSGTSVFQIRLDSAVCVAQNPCVRVTPETTALSKVHVTMLPGWVITMAHETFTPPTTVGVRVAAPCVTTQVDAMSWKPAGGLGSPTLREAPASTGICPVVTATPDVIVVRLGTVKPVEENVKVPTPPWLILFTMTALGLSLLLIVQVAAPPTASAMFAPVCVPPEHDHE